jgi:hypothetical protein
MAHVVEHWPSKQDQTLVPPKKKRNEKDYPIPTNCSESVANQRQRENI